MPRRRSRAWKPICTCRFANDVSLNSARPPAESRGAGSVIAVAEVGSRLRRGDFGELDGRRVLSNLVEAPLAAGPLAGDWQRNWSQLQTHASKSIDAGIRAVTGSEIAPPLAAILVTDLAAADRRQLVSALRGQGFITVDSVAALAADFVRRNDPNELADRIRKARPALIMIAFKGPQGEAAAELATQVVRHLYCATAPSPQPLVALLGNPQAIAAARALLDSNTEVLTLSVDAVEADNLQALHQQFASAYLRAIAPRMAVGLPPGLHEKPLIPLTAALRRAAWRLSHLMGLRVAVVHAEPRGITLALADNGAVRIASFGHLAPEGRGGHFGLQLDMDEISQWLPARLPAAEIQKSLLERAGRPWGVPAAPGDRLIQEAAVVAGIARARTQLRITEFECDLAVASGLMLGADCAPLPAAACLLNGLLPVRFCQLAQDQASVLPMLGCLDLLGEAIDPTDALVPLALTVAVTGSARVNEPAVHLALDLADGTRTDEVVPFGTTLRVAAAADHPVRVSAAPAGGLDIGGGAGRAVGLAPVLATGAGGVLVDARGRPPATGDDGSTRAELVLSWQQGLDAYGLESGAVTGDHD